MSESLDQKNTPLKAHTAKMGLGLAALGRPGYINLGHQDDLKRDYSPESMQRRAHEVLDAAWQAGIRYFDAARSYGKAEVFLASWVKAKKVDPADITVASKWGYTYTADWQVSLPNGQAHEVKQHSLERLNAQHHESRQLLGEQLDLYQVHSATLESGVLDNQEVLSRLGELRDHGLAIGLSVSGPAQDAVVRKALECHVGGRQVFAAVQATWNLLEPSAGEALREASNAGWRVIVKEGVANGRLTDRNYDPAFKSRRQKLEAMAERLESTIDAVSLAAVLAQPWAGVVLSGAAAAQQVCSNVAALTLSEKVTPDQWKGLVGELAEAPEEYWATRSGLSWN
jgi:aryl-alcohol dehydrogenase-like predicted oxidoreductase